MWVSSRLCPADPTTIITMIPLQFLGSKQCPPPWPPSRVLEVLVGSSKSPPPATPDFEFTRPPPPQFHPAQGLSHGINFLLGCRSLLGLPAERQEPSEAASGAGGQARRPPALPPREPHPRCPSKSSTSGPPVTAVATLPHPEIAPNPGRHWPSPPGPGCDRAPAKPQKPLTPKAAVPGSGVTHCLASQGTPSPLTRPPANVDPPAISSLPGPLPASTLTAGEKQVPDLSPTPSPDPPGTPLPEKQPWRGREEGRLPRTTSCRGSGCPPLTSPHAHHRDRPTSQLKFAPAPGPAAAQPGLQTEGGKEGEERPRARGTRPGSRRGRERASQRASERGGLGEGSQWPGARTRAGEATLGPRSPDATGAPSPPPRPGPHGATPRGLPTSAAGAVGLRAAGSGGRGARGAEQGRGRGGRGPGREAHGALAPLARPPGARPLRHICSSGREGGRGGPAVRGCLRGRAGGREEGVGRRREEGPAAAEEGEEEGRGGRPPPLPSLARSLPPSQQNPSHRCGPRPGAPAARRGVRVGGGGGGSRRWAEGGGREGGAAAGSGHREGGAREGKGAPSRRRAARVLLGRILTHPPAAPPPARGQR
ncbi:uncharacterized protein LOC144338319 [Macaca mulatta]